MSLKAFHLFFIAVSILLSIGCAAWAFVNEMTVFGLGFALLGIVLVVYGINFIKKSKRIIT
jgi:hypothetical protein